MIGHWSYPLVGFILEQAKWLLLLDGLVWLLSNVGFANIWMVLMWLYNFRFVGFKTIYGW